MDVCGASRKMTDGDKKIMNRLMNSLSSSKEEPTLFSELCPDSTDFELAYLLVYLMMLPIAQILYEVQSNTEQCYN
jgi:hypothetical protein